MGQAVGEQRAEADNPKVSSSLAEIDVFSAAN
jgi:hypothetical protein